VKAWSAAFLCGLVFSVGLGLSGMTNPGKVIAFLDVLGRWDPTLAFVMMGAMGTHALLFRLVTRRSKPILVPRFSIPARRDLDRSLLLGSALFGVGWGLSGYCPGPALASLVGGGRPALVFTASMFAGMAAYGLVPRAEPVSPAPGARP